MQSGARGVEGDESLVVPQEDVVVVALEKAGGEQLIVASFFRRSRADHDRPALAEQCAETVEEPLVRVRAGWFEEARDLEERRRQAGQLGEHLGALLLEIALVEAGV